MRYRYHYHSNRYHFKDDVCIILIDKRVHLVGLHCHQSATKPLWLRFNMSGTACQHTSLRQIHFQLIVDC